MNAIRPPGARRSAPLAAALALAAGAAFAAHGGAGAADLCADRRGDVPPDEILEASGAVVGKVEIEVQNVFDPSKPHEDRLLYRIANRAHRTTRPRVIAGELLLHEGDPFSHQAVEESERILRKNRFFYDAAICPVGWDGKTVDLDVVTRDVWTLRAGLNFGRGGGVNKTRVYLADENLLGTGKGILVSHSTSVDRTEDLLRYADPLVFGRKVRAELIYSDNSDGKREQVYVERPFYSLGGKWALGVLGSRLDEIDSLYDFGHVTDKFTRHEETWSLFGGVSRGLIAGATSRLVFGFNHSSDRFALAAGGSARLPEDRVLSYPWIGVEHVTDDFAKERNRDQIGRTEDIAYGLRWSTRLGYSARAFGASDNDWILSVGLDDGVRLGPRTTLFGSLALDGRFDQHGAENAFASASLRLFWRDFGEQLFYASLAGDSAWNLDRDQQLLLGGDNGLRGYPLRYQQGDRRVLATVEQRFFTDWYPLRLVRVGGAVFADVGRAWFEDSANPGIDREWLADVGAGLRFAITRSGLGNVIHVDVAMPLQGGSSVKKLQVVVKTEARF
ncbi:MAG: hypothetical protein U0X73_14880 [Thermoanaerobaculia bacterium]